MLNIKWSEKFIGFRMMFFLVFSPVRILWNMYNPYTIIYNVLLWQYRYAYFGVFSRSFFTTSRYISKYEIFFQPGLYRNSYRYRISLYILSRKIWLKTFNRFTWIFELFCWFSFLYIYSGFKDGFTSSEWR